MKEYNLTLSEKQVEELSIATEFLSRLKSGQLDYYLADDLISIVGDTVTNSSEIKEKVQELKELLFPELNKNESIGISNVDESGKRLWDIHQLLRHRLSWDYAIEKGLTDGNKRNWSDGIMGVSYDEPMKYSDQELAKIEKL